MTTLTSLIPLSNAVRQKSSLVGPGTMIGGKKEEQIMAATIARMTACDDLSFCVFATSSYLRRALLALGMDKFKMSMALGYQVPKSENSVKKTGYGTRQDN